MFHRVAAIGAGDAQSLPKGLTLESLLFAVGAEEGASIDREDGVSMGGWEAREGERLLARWEPEAIRVSVSWKAEVFASGEARDRRVSAEGGLALSTVVERFRDDLAGRGTPIAAVSDPLRDPSFIEALSHAYPLPDVADPARA